MKTKLSIDVEFDGDKTDPESLASVADMLLQTALSTPGVLDEYGNPQFGEFFVEPVDPNRHHCDPRFGTEDRCPSSASGHEPEWTTTHVECDIDMYVDVLCKHCGRRGCIGPEEKSAEQISW
jgi:hypothetical protein